MDVMNDSDHLTTVFLGKVLSSGSSQETYLEVC